MTGSTTSNRPRERGGGGADQASGVKRPRCRIATQSGSHRSETVSGGSRTLRRFGHEWLGLRPADGGQHRYYDVGLEHLAFEVDTRDEVDEAYRRCLARDANIHHPPETDNDPEDYYAFFVFDPDGFRIEVFCQCPTSPGSRDRALD